MPKVNPDRDLVMAEAGYVRAAIIAKLFDVETSTVTRWPKDKDSKITNIKANGLNWLTWSAVRLFRKDEAEIRNLPLDAMKAVALYRSTIDG